MDANDQTPATENAAAATTPVDQTHAAAPAAPSVNPAELEVASNLSDEALRLELATRDRVRREAEEAARLAKGREAILKVLSENKPEDKDLVSALVAKYHTHSAKKPAASGEKKRPGRPAGSKNKVA